MQKPVHEVTRNTFIADFLSANPIPNILQKTSLIGAKFYHEKTSLKIWFKDILFCIWYNTV